MYMKLREYTDNLQYLPLTHAAWNTGAGWLCPIILAVNWQHTLAGQAEKGNASKSRAPKPKKTKSRPGKGELAGKDGL